MKKLYIFLLIIIAIPMSGLAQEPINNHVFPEVTFTYKGETFVVSAWDALSDDPGAGARVKNTGVKSNPDAGDTGKTEYDGIIVPTYSAISTSTGRPKSDFSLTAADIEAGEKIVVHYGGNNYEFTDFSSIKYKSFIEGFARDIYLLSRRLITGSYVLPKVANAYDEDEYATKYNIIEVADGGYAKSNRSKDQGYFCPSEIIIPSNITSIGKYAFMANGNLKKVNFDDLESVQITSFPEGLFAECIYLEEVTIPSQVTSIDKYAFGGCTHLGYLYPQAETSPTISNEAFLRYPGSPVTVELEYKYTVVWGKSHQMVRNYRNDATNTIWKELSFRIPLEIPASGYASFYSDQPVWGKVPSKAPGANNDSKPSWKNNTDGIDVVYLTSKSSSIGQSVTQNTDGTFSFSQWKWSGNSDKAIYNLGLVIYNPLGNGEKFTADLYSPAQSHYIDPEKDLMKGTCDLEGVNMDALISDPNTGISNPETGNLYFILKNGQFVRCTGGNLAPYKAYLEIPLSYFKGFDIRTEAKDFTISLDDSDTDGIRQIENGKMTIENGVVYDLQGRVVSINGLQALPKGIYIMNGKKYTK